MEESESCSILEEAVIRRFEGLTVKLDKDEKVRRASMRFENTDDGDGYSVCYLLYPGRLVFGMKFAMFPEGGQPLDRELNVSPSEQLPDAIFVTSLWNPNTGFRLSAADGGVGIADVRDLRTGGLLTLRFDLSKTDLWIFAIPEPPMDNLVFGWNLGYDPFQQ